MENIEVTVDELISGVDKIECNVECKIDEDELNQLLELCKAEYPHIPEYFHYVYSVDYLMNN
jgi:hypothetical protein